MKNVGTAKANAAPRRAAIYCRISKDVGGDELGVRRQERLCRALADDHGWEVVDVFVDDNLSAFKQRKRPGFDKLCDAIRAGAVDAVVVYNPDRLSRDNLRGLEDLIDLLNAHGVEVQSVHSGEYDLSTAHGRMMARMAGVVARMESEKMSERLRDKMDELAAHGRPNGGQRPFGYQRVGRKDDVDEHGKRVDTRRLEKHPTEAPVVVEVFNRVLAGETITAIARSFNTRGLTTTQGGPWSPANLRNVATNPVYANLRVHRGDVVGEGSWPQLVPEEVWQRSVKILRDRREAREHGQGRSTPRRNLLSGGLVVCGKCGKKLWGKPRRGPNGERLVLYGCNPATAPKYPGCGGVFIRADYVDRLVSDRVIEVVESAGFARSLAKRAGADAGAVADARKIETALDDLADAYADNKVSMREWVRARDRLHARLIEAHDRMAADTTDAAVGSYVGRDGRLRADWDQMPLDQRQSIIRAVIEPVVIRPADRRAGGRFDETRVQVVERD